MYGSSSAKPFSLMVSRNVKVGQDGYGILDIMLKGLIVLMLMGWSSLVLAIGLQVGDQAPDFVLSNLEGKLHRLSDYEEQMVVLEWVDYDCDYVTRLYQEGRVQTMQQHVHDLGHKWLTIVSGSQGLFWKKNLAQQFTDSRSRAHTLLVDRKGVVGRLYVAPSVPFFVIVDQEGTVRYRGSFDNQPHLMVNTVQGVYEPHALDAFHRILQEEDLIKDTVKLYGCDIDY